MSKKVLFSVIATAALCLFGLLCFFEFFFAWNTLGKENIFEIMYIGDQNRNFFIDLCCSFSINETVWRMGRPPESFTFLDMLNSFFGKTIPRGNYEEPIGALLFIREDWLQLILLLAAGAMLAVKAFQPKWISGKELALPFAFLTLLAGWNVVKEVIDSWQYMYGSQRLPEGAWQQYYSPLMEIFGSHEPSKFLAFLPIFWQLIENLLMVAAFGAATLLVGSDRLKNLFFLPAAIAAAAAVLALFSNLLGLGFHLSWQFGGILVFFLVDLLLVGGLLLVGMAMREGDEEETEAASQPQPYGAETDEKTKETVMQEDV